MVSGSDEEGWQEKEEEMQLTLDGSGGSDLLHDMFSYSNDVKCNGLLIDYLVRKRTHPRMGEFCKFLLKPPAVLLGAHPYSDGIELVHAEMLLAMLKRLIVYCFKSLGDPAWTRVTHLRQHIQEIVDFKRESVALNCEVDSWISLFQQNNMQVKEPKEDDDVRRLRLKDFWAQYHTGYKLVNPKKGTAGSGHTPPTSSNPKSRPLPLDSFEDVSTTSPACDPWKLRPASRTGKHLRCRTKHPICASSIGTDMAFDGSFSLQSFTPAMSRSCSRPTSKHSASPQWSDMSPVKSRPSTSSRICAKVYEAWPASSQSDLSPSKSRPRSSTSGFGSSSQRLSATPPSRPGSRPGTKTSRAYSAKKLSGSSPANSRPCSRASTRTADTFATTQLSFSSTHSFNESKAKAVSKIPQQAGSKIPQQVQRAFLLSANLKKDHGGRRSGNDSRRLESNDTHSASMPDTLSLVSTPHAQTDLLDAEPLFGRPYRKFLDMQKHVNSPTHLYLRACDDNLVMPSLMPFCTGDSDRLIGRGQAMSDHNLRAVTEMFPGITSIREVDLEGNANLTDKSVAPLVNRLFEPCAQQSLEILNLKNCLRFATGPGIQEVMDSMVTLIETGALRLRKLDLSGIAIGMKSHLPLCMAIKQHTALDTVSLAEVGFGFNPQVKDCLAELLASRSIIALDLSWNSFSISVFTHLGRCLVDSRVLRTLNVANSSAISKNHIYSNPVEYFVELLAYNEALTCLDISLNRIDFRGALVVEAALEQNKQLTTLNISSNPLCVLGFRSALRLLARDSCALIHLHCENCISGSVTEAATEAFQVFSVTNPTGRYQLDLSRPYSRALLQMLYKTCERYDLPPAQAFHEVIVRSGRSYSHPSKDPDSGVWRLPVDGSLEIFFSIQTAMEKALKDVPDSDFSGLMKRHYEFVRVMPSRSKMIPLFSLWRNIDGKEVEQLVMLDALSKDFLFTYPMFEQICKSRAVVGEAAWRLLPSLGNGPSARYLAMQLMPTLGEFLQLVQRSRKLLVFNIDNPTGHYELDLGNCCDFAVAEQLLLLDRWERSIAQRKSLEDVSQRGIATQVRNEAYQSKALEAHGVQRIYDFNMPEYGTLEFDYVSSARPPPDANPISDTTFAEMLKAMHAAKCSPYEQIKAMILVSHYFYLCALQMRALLGIFKDTVVRAEFLVRLFMRLTDMHNEKIFRARFSDRSELLQLQHRLGHVTFFPFIQPEQSLFEFDLSVHDQRLAMYALLTITAKEVYTNLREYSYTLPDGSKVDLQLGIPRSWEVLDGLPKTGTFRARYNSAPEDRNYKERLRLMARYGFWHAPAEKEVMWWSLIQDCPPDVVDFVHFIYTHYRDIWKVFKLLDGARRRDGMITLAEFKEALDDMHCKKFDGNRKIERITNVFRYLDPSGEGKVSELEWRVMEQLFKEIQLSIQEFVQFCERTFGENLIDAWDQIDADGSGEIDKEEWLHACNNLGFFGLTDSVFSFLDKRNMGGITQHDFLELESLQSKKQS